MAVCRTETGTITVEECMAVLKTMTRDQFVHPDILDDMTNEDLLAAIDKYCESNRKLTVNFEVNIPLDSQRKKDITFQNNRCTPLIDPNNNKNKKLPTFADKTYCFNVNIPSRSNLDAGDDLNENNFPYNDNYPLDPEDPEYDAEQKTACNGGCGRESSANTTLRPPNDRQERHVAPADPDQPHQTGSIFKQVCVTITADEYLNPVAGGAGLVVRKTAYIDLGSPCGGVGGLPGNPKNVGEPGGKGDSHRTDEQIAAYEKKREYLMQKWREWLAGRKDPDIDGSAARCICNFVACYSNSSLTRVGTYKKEKTGGLNDREEKVEDLGNNKYGISMGRGDDGNTFLNISFTADTLSSGYPDNENEVISISGPETWIKFNYSKSGSSSEAAYSASQSCGCSSTSGPSFPPGSVQREESDASFAAGGYSLVCKGCTPDQTAGSVDPNQNAKLTEMENACKKKADSRRTFIFCDQNGNGNLATVEGTYSDIFNHPPVPVPFYLINGSNSKYFDGAFYEIRTVDGKQRIVEKGTDIVQGTVTGPGQCGGNAPNPPNNPDPVADPNVVGNPPDKDPDPDKTEPTNDVTEF